MVRRHALFLVLAANGLLGACVMGAPDDSSLAKTYSKQSSGSGSDEAAGTGEAAAGTGDPVAAGPAVSVGATSGSGGGGNAAATSTTTGAGVGGSPASTSASSATGGIAAATWTELYSTLFGTTGAANCSANGQCHTQAESGLRCGTDQATCYQGFVDSGWVNPGANAANSPLVAPGASPLCGLGGTMPTDCTYNFSSTDVERIQSWLGNGAAND